MVLLQDFQEDRTSGLGRRVYREQNVTPKPRLFLLPSGFLLPGQLRATHHHLDWSMREKLSGLVISLQQFCRQEFVWGHQGARSPRGGCGEGLKAWEEDNQLCRLKTRNSSMRYAYRRGAVGMQTLAALSIPEASCPGREEKSRTEWTSRRTEKGIEPGRQNDCESEVPTLPPRQSYRVDGSEQGIWGKGHNTAGRGLDFINPRAIWVNKGTWH